MTKIILSLLMSLLWVSTAISAGPEKSNSGTANWSVAMRTLQKTLSELEPFLFNGKDYNDPKQQTDLKEKFRRLAKESRDISHSPILVDQDPTVRFVASQFSRDLERASLAYAEGKSDFARYQVIKVTSLCIQCHTRSQHGPSFSFKKTESFFSLMSPADQAEYLIASRRFDQAYKLLTEKLEASQKDSVVSDQTDRLARLAMVIAVQHEQDPAKAEKVCELILKNKSAPSFLKIKAEEWKKSVAQWKSEKKAPASIAELQDLLKKKQNEVEAMRVIPGVLKILSAEKSAEQGEALLLAGESYEILKQIMPMDLHENYYESCIRNASHTTVAKSCFKKLYDSVKSGYTGSFGTQIPVFVEVWLNDLKKLTE